ncbi:MAG: pyrroline-5-carboxylate reductase [Tepidanaerobacteraceae bacterium]|jgi:pyrroline-5-carboxylate reductase
MGKNLGIIGAGSLAEAFLKGILEHKTFLPENIYVINRSDDHRLNFFKENYFVNITRSYKEIAAMCDVLVIAVKPKDIIDLMAVLGKFLNENHIIISVVAGITTKIIEDTVSKNIRVIRAMPNTSCQIKESATAVACGTYADSECIKIAESILLSIGKVIRVDEGCLDAVTGLSGSGPAYVYLMMEAMTEAGIMAGLDRGISEKLAAQTVFGAAKMVLETGEGPEYLRQKVTSPGGTTVAGLNVLEKEGFTKSIIEAVNSAARRSRQIMLENKIG